MATKKGFQVLIEILPALLAELPELRVVLAGGGDLLDALPRGGRSPGGSGVHLPRRRCCATPCRTSTGRRTSSCCPPCTTRKGNVDGLPNVILEAMASGLPVVASGISGIPLAVEDGRTGLLVPEGDRAALLGALRRLLADPAAARCDGGAGAAQGRGGADLGRGRGALPGGVPGGAGISLARAGLISYTSGTPSASSAVRPALRASPMATKKTPHPGITKADLVDVVYDRHGGLTKDEAAEIVDTIFRTVKTSLADGRPVRIKNFGTFEVTRRPGPDGGQPGERRADVHPSAQGPELQARRGACATRCTRHRPASSQ